MIAVRRGTATFAPNGQTELRRGDRLTILVPAPYADGVGEAITRASAVADPPADAEAGRAEQAAEQVAEVEAGPDDPSDAPDTPR